MSLVQGHRSVVERHTRPLPDVLPSAVAWIGIAGMLATAALGAAGWTGGPGHGLLVAAAGLLLGIPHGAVDHLLPDPRTGTRPRRWGLAAVLAGYAAVVVGFLAAAFAVPGLALVAFLAFSTVHFGSADVAFNRWRRGTAGATGPRDGFDLGVQTLGYGAPMCLLYFLRWPGEVGTVLANLVPGAMHYLADPARIGAYAALAAIAATVARHLRSGARLEALELVTVFLCAWFAPPLVSFGVYFALWHSLRHAARVSAVLPGVHPLLERRRFARASARVVLHVLPTTLGSYACMAAVFLAAQNGLLRDHLLRDSVAAVLAAVTIPHGGMVLRYDKRLLSPARGYPPARSNR